MSAPTKNPPSIPTWDTPVSDATVILGQRRRQRRRRVWLRVLIAVLVLAVLVTAGWLVGFSSVLATERVTVVGTEVTDPDRVREAAAVPLGEPLSRLQPDEIASRVGAIPAVASVQVERRWPHTVAITVTERTPVMKVVRNGTATWVDADGVAFHEGGSGSEASADLLRASVDPSDAGALQAAAAVAAALPPKVRALVDVLNASSPEAITLKLDGGRTVVWGGSGQTELKAQVLTALLANKKATKGVSTIDVSGPANPTTR